MKRNALFLIVAGVLILTAIKAPRGIRNNNPGNVRENDRVDYDWLGEAVIDNDDEFEVFKDARYGIRAIARIVTTYQNKYGINTVRGVINRWAPPNENKTDSYVRHVASVLKVNPDEVINLQHYLLPLIEAIIIHENGYNPYSMELISEGIQLA
jgi:hypothetical protein